MINHCYIYHVLLALLLQSAQAPAKSVTDQLIAQANQQQQQLINTYGPSNNQAATHACDALINKLALSQFKSCLIIQAPFANAYSAANGQLILTEGLLKELRNPDQLAHILAHEYAHLLLQHHQQAHELVNNPPTFFTKSRIKKFYRKMELAADEWANQHLPKHGFDATQIHHYLMRLASTNKERTDDHIPLSQRIKKTGLMPEKTATAWLAEIQRQASTE